MKKIKDNLFLIVILLIFLICLSPVIISAVSSLVSYYSSPIYHEKNRNLEYINKGDLYYTDDKEEFITDNGLDNYDETTKEIAWKSYLYGVDIGMTRTVDIYNGEMARLKEFRDD